MSETEEKQPEALGDQLHPYCAKFEHGRCPEDNDTCACLCHKPSRMPDEPIHS